MLNTIIETTIIALIAAFVIYIPVFMYCKSNATFNVLFFIKNFLVSAISALTFTDGFVLFVYYIYRG